MAFDFREEALRGYVAFRDMLDRFMSESFIKHTGERINTGPGTFPVDVIDGVDGYTLVASLAGVSPESLMVQAQGNYITIRGERSLIDLGEDQQWVTCEHHTTTFSRSLFFTQPIDAEHAQAVIANGLLTLDLPKVTITDMKSIPVFEPAVIDDLSSEELEETGFVADLALPALETLSEDDLSTISSIEFIPDETSIDETSMVVAVDEAQSLTEDAAVEVEPVVVEEAEFREVVAVEEILSEVERGEATETAGATAEVAEATMIADGEVEIETLIATSEAFPEAATEFMSDEGVIDEISATTEEPIIAEVETFVENEGVIESVPEIVSSEDAIVVADVTADRTFGGAQADVFMVEGPRGAIEADALVEEGDAVPVGAPIRSHEEVS